MIATLVRTVLTYLTLLVATPIVPVINPNARHDSTVYAKKYAVCNKPVILGACNGVCGVRG